MSESAPSKSHVPLEDLIPQASLESILCTEELHRRSCRSPDYEKESRALVALVSALADSPRSILQTLAETILDITQCDSAGLSLLTRDGKTPDLSGERFYWPAIAGMWNPHVGGGTPRNFGPCGDVLDQNRTLLFRHFERRYPYLLPVMPAAEECLLVPFLVHGKAVGTIWAIMHSPRRKFDAEDSRVMDSLGKFASSAYQAVVSIDELKFQVAEREKAEADLRKLTDGLEGQVRARTAELRRSEERLRLAQQAARIGTFEWNIQTGVNTWTPELEEMYGLPAGGFGGTQTAFENLVHPDDRAEVIALVGAALRTGQPTKGEWRVVWSDGSVHWISGRWQVLRDESGEPSRMLGVNLDITERKREEQELATASERLRLAIESGSVGGWDYNLTTGKKVWFGETHAQLGMAPDETSGSFEEFWDRVHKDDREHLLHAVQVAKDKHEQFTEDFRVVWRDGTTHWLRSRGRYYYAANREPERLLGLSIDITDRKRTEETLRESEERLRLAAQAGKMYAFDWDVTTGVLVRSSEYVNVLGATEPETLTHQQAMEKIHPDDRPKLVADAARLSPGSPRVDETYRVLLPGKSPVWVKSSGRAFFDPDGRMVRMIGMVADITEQKQIEDTIRESEVRYRRIVETTNEGVWLLDSKLHTSYVNRQMAEMLGYEPEEMIGRSVLDFYFPEDVEQKRQVLSRRQQGRRERLDERLRRKDGSELWVRMAASPVFTDNGKFDGALAMMSDITERRLAEEALQESEKRFRLVANTAPVMIWMAGPDKKTTYFNQLWLDFTGLSEAYLQNGLEGIVHPEDYPQCHDVYCRGFDQRQPFRKECRLRRHDGQYRWMLDIGVPRFHEDGSFAGYIGSCVDVSDRKLAEDALADINRKLIETQEQERARIARELHDDINQRLALLSVKLEQLQDNPSEVRSRVQELRTQTTEISNDVQALSHDLHSSPLEYLGVAAGMKSWCKEFGERQGMQIDYRYDVRSTVPSEIGLSLFRVLQEALHNAQKHSGVRRVEVQLAEHSNEVHLTVRDSGRGFDVEASKQSRGLGLTSLRERVRLVNGTIAIDSKPMGGTTIHVRVPIRSERFSERAVG